MSNESKCRLACEAVLLFHSGSPWDDEKQSKWRQIACEILGEPRFHDYHYARNSMVPTSFEATTRVLCDMVREALKQQEVV